jgi:hypothetical protein
MSDVNSLPNSYSAAVRAANSAPNPFAAMKAGWAFSEEYAKLTPQQRQAAVDSRNLPHDGWAMLGAFRSGTDISPRSLR